MNTQLLEETIKNDSDFQKLLAVAKDTLNPRQLTEDAKCGKIAAALMTDKGNIYRGICIDVPCSMGFCAEHAAISAMLTSGECTITKLVAVSAKHGIVSPCGRCREFIYQINYDNKACKILLKDKIVTLSYLLPDSWK